MFGFYLTGVDLVRSGEWPGTVSTSNSCDEFGRSPLKAGSYRNLNVRSLTSLVTWLVVWNHGILWLSIQLGMSSSQLTNSYSSEGWLNHQPDEFGQLWWFRFLCRSFELENRIQTGDVKVLKQARADFSEPVILFWTPYFEHQLCVTMPSFEILRRAHSELATPLRKLCNGLQHQWEKLATSFPLSPGSD